MVNLGGTVPNRSPAFPAVTSLTRRTSSMMTRARSLAHSAKAQALRDGGISPAHQTDEGAEGGGAEDGRPNDEFHPAAAVSMAFDATGAWPRRQVEFGQLSVVDDAVSVVDDVDIGELQTLSCLLSCLMAAHEALIDGELPPPPPAAAPAQVRLSQLDGSGDELPAAAGTHHAPTVCSCGCCSCG